MSCLEHGGWRQILFSIEQPIPFHLDTLRKGEVSPRDVHMTATLKYLGIFFLLAICTTFATAQVKVKVHYDHKAKFMDYKTFMWQRAANTLAPEMSKPLMRAVNTQLKARGWKLVTANPDVSIVANTATKEKKTVETFYDGQGSWRFRMNTDTEPDPNQEVYTEGTMVVDLFDHKDERVIFRGVATGKVLSDTKAAKTVRMDKVIAEMFKDFPPQK
jgi:hypothetical protein